MTTDVDAFLAHYGVKGMRWGIIRKASAGKTESGGSSEALKLPRPPSAYRTMLEAKYQKAGSSRAEAVAKADKAIRIQKVVAIAGAATLATALAYAGGAKLAKEFTGVKLAEGTTFQHISKSGSLDLSDSHLYTTWAKTDKFNYQGTFAAELGGNANAISLKSIGKITAPSNAQGQKILAESMGKAKISRSTYDDFVRGYYKNGDGDMYKKFKETMGKKGFNAVIDTTDQNFYAKAYKPVIVFDSKNNLVQKGARAISNKEMMAKFTATKLAQSMVKPDKLVRITAGTATGSLFVAGAMKSNNVAIDKYLAKHPNSTLTRADAALALGLV
jgi:hypothetical protein